MIYLNGKSDDFHYPVEALLERTLNCHKVLLTPSCTAALELSALALDIQPGDEVIIPSFTFPSTANAFVLRGATPIWCDIRPDTLNMNEVLLPNLITPKTKAIVPVHYGGVACNMDAILSYGIPVVEDNAHGLFGSYYGKSLGTLGDLGCLSFHHTKNYSSGEGGAILINDKSLIEKIEIIREKGTNRQSFLRGEIAKYEWVALGSSYIMSDLLTYRLYDRLSWHRIIQQYREQIWHRYERQLKDWANTFGVWFQNINTGSSYHLFVLVSPSVDFRIGLQRHLAERGIQAATHFQPLHLSPYGKQWPGDCPIAEDISQLILRLPMYNDMTMEAQDTVIEAVLSYEP